MGVNFVETRFDMAAGQAVLAPTHAEPVGAHAHRMRAGQHRISENILREDVDITHPQLPPDDVGALIRADGPPALRHERIVIKSADRHVHDIESLVANRELCLHDGRTVRQNECRNQTVSNPATQSFPLVSKACPAQQWQKSANLRDH